MPRITRARLSFTIIPTLLTEPSPPPLSKPIIAPTLWSLPSDITFTQPKHFPLSDIGGLRLWGTGLGVTHASLIAFEESYVAPDIGRIGLMTPHVTGMQCIGGGN